MAKVKNEALHQAKINKKDEFYTQLPDIEKELSHYKDHFKDKIVLCNCDDPFESNFFKYFTLNFNHLGLKKLICIGYENSPVSGEQLSFFDNPKEMKHSHVLEITEVKDYNGDGRENLLDIEWLLKNDKNTWKELKGNGDFRSPESIEYLKEADIVVTNPPFSLFREYINQLIEYNKDFIILGNQNAITYKEIFPLIKDGKVFFGASIHSGDREFRVPNDYPLKASGYRIDENGHKYIRVKGIRWYTNIDHKQRHESLILYKEYDPEDYPKYDNYDAIEVSKTKEIPKDYDGAMGVPITFFDKYNPNQFEVLGELKHGSDGEFDFAKPIINGKEKYTRIVIKRK